MISNLALITALLATVVGCAGSAPDYSERTRSAVQKQNQITAWLVADSSKELSRKIVAPVCSSTVGHPPEGWAIDAGSWCVVACPVLPENKVFDRWMYTHDGLRCFATEQASTNHVKTEFEMSHWRLDQQVLFRGFDRSFVRDTEWTCQEQEYQIDPENQKGFWVDLKRIGNIYRFYDDGALMIGRAGQPVKFAGDWRGTSTGGVAMNDQTMFRYAVNYGGGRFDEFASPTRKQVCRFKDNPGTRS